MPTDGTLSAATPRAIETHETLLHLANCSIAEAFDRVRMVETAEGVNAVDGKCLRIVLYSRVFNLCN